MDPATTYDIIRKIHESASRFVLALTGGGAEAGGALLRVPGGSRSVREAGDGNLPPSVLYDAAAGEAEAAHAAEAEVLRTALALGGTVSAEHGIGLLKRPFLAKALDPVALELVRAVKRAFDPKGILNPGKLLP